MDEQATPEQMPTTAADPAATSMGMSEKERFDALMMLAEFWTGRIAARAMWERQFSFGLWAGLAAAIYAIKMRPPDWELGATLVLISVFYTFGWIRPVWERTESDHRHAHCERTDAQRLLDPSIERSPFEPIAKGETIFGWLEDWASKAMVGVTIGMCVAAFFLIGHLG